MYFNKDNKVFAWIMFLISSSGLICIATYFLLKDKITIILNNDTFNVIIFFLFLIEFLLSILRIFNRN